MKNVIVIGRPNVGKSTLLIVYWEKTAITAREEGVTRDIRYFEQTWNGKTFRVCDTGGIIYTKKPSNPYQHQINQMIENELESAYRIIFMVDFNFPNHPDDITIRQHLKRYSKKTLLVINKADNFERLDDIHPFYAYGFDEMYPVSAFQNTGIGDLLDTVVADMGELEREADDGKINIALIGKPNAGKSSLYNGLFNKEKAIVDARMGTTRDINESLLKVSGRLLNFMDTAGLRRRRKVSDTIEYFSIIRTERAIEDADIVIYMIDAEELLTDQDKKLLNDIFKQGKNCIVFVNKWDLLSRNTNTRNDIIKILEYEVPTLAHFPILMGSAKEKHNIQPLLNTIIDVVDASSHRVSTPDLNDFLKHFFSINHPPSKKGKLFKIYYATQVSVCPTQFVFKVNDAKLLTKPFLRNFEKEFRQFFPNAIGVGMKFEFRSKENV